MRNSNNIFWILGGLPKKRDKINLKDFKSNIVKIYLIGKNIKYFKKQIGNKVDYYPSKNLKKSLIQIMKDVKIFKKKNNTILLSPSSASYDQFLNFEKEVKSLKDYVKFMQENIFKSVFKNYWRNIDKNIFFSFIVLFF